MEKRFWYAIERDEQDADWGMGSFDLTEAIEMAKKNECQYIAKIDADYDENGEETTEAICIGVNAVEEAEELEIME